MPVVRARAAPALNSWDERTWCLRGKGLDRNSCTSVRRYTMNVGAGSGTLNVHSAEMSPTPRLSRTVYRSRVVRPRQGDHGLYRRRPPSYGAARTPISGWVGRVHDRCLVTTG